MKPYALSAALLLSLLATTVVLGGCTLTRGYRAAPAAAALTPDTPVLVVITQARLHADRRARFDAYTRQIIRALDTGDQPGFLGFSLRFQLFGDGVWTMSVWRDRASMLAFSRSGLHREAMREAEEAIASFTVRTHTVPFALVPLTWTQALALPTSDAPGYGRDPAAPPSPPTESVR